MGRAATLKVCIIQPIRMAVNGGKGKITRFDKAVEKLESLATGLGTVRWSVLLLWLVPQSIKRSCDPSPLRGKHPQALKSGSQMLGRESRWHWS